MSELLDETAEAEDNTGPDTPQADAAPADPVETPAAEASPEPDPSDPRVAALIEQAAAERAQAQNAQLIEALANAGLLHTEEGQVGPPDPSDYWDNPGGYQQALEQYLEARDAQRLAPFQEFVAAQQTEQLRSTVQTEIAGAVEQAKLENPPEASLIGAIADGFMGSAQQQFGATPFARQQAIRQAVEFIATERKAAGEAAVKNYRQQIEGIADTPAEPGAAGGGVQIEAAPKTYDEILAKHLGRLAA